MVEGKKKAAKNENEYIYHEEVPDLSNLQEVKGASLVKGIEFNINDPEVFAYLTTLGSKLDSFKLCRCPDLIFSND